MAGFKQSSCRLCLKDITDKGFQVIDDVTRNILDTLLLLLKFHGGTKEVICNACNRKLNAAFLFKLTCLNTNNTIIPHVGCETMLQVDFGGICMKENENGHLMDIPGNHKICRFCTQLINGETKSLGEEEFEVIYKFIPEMNIEIKDPVVCKPCFDSLCTHNTFLKECLEVEQIIVDNIQCSATDSRTDTTSPDLFVKTENLDNMEIAIKTECVDIKSEDEDESYTILLHSNNEIFDNSEYKDAEEEDCDPLKVQLYKCKECDYESRYKCSFVTHQLKHKDPSEVQMYRCNDCEYKTKYKNGIKHHVLQHKDPSQVQMYKCKECDYESRYKRSLNNHQLIHEYPSELYKCMDCDYKTKSMNNLACHALQHKGFPLEQMYKCNDCDYRTKFRGNLRYHVQKHKNPSQVEMHKCDSCNYESIYKHSVIRHQVKHNSSEAQMYRCNDCDYKTKHKRSLKRHAIKHTGLSQMYDTSPEDPVQIYKCNVCDFESRYKANVIKHQSIHEEVQMYTCNDCNYKSKYKRSLTRHVLLHKDPSQMQKYKCQVCDNEFRHKNNLIAHQLIHLDSSLVQMYKCETCNFETKYKRSLRFHTLKHKRKLQNFKCNS